jgi:hypothetical protein
MPINEKVSVFDQDVLEAGGYIKFADFVPMFCPSYIALAAKFIKPFIETTPLLRDLACAVVVIIGEKTDLP